jgi:hypothetical protein
MGALVFWGRGLLIGGVAGALLSAAPALVLSQLPPQYSDSFIGTLAALLTLTVTPLGIVAASVGALLLLVGWLRRR